MRTAIVNYKGVELECSYEFDPAERQTSDRPGYPAEAHMDSCKVIAGDRRVQIIEMLTGSQIEAIEGMLADGAVSQREDLRLAA